MKKIFTAAIVALTAMCVSLTADSPAAITIGGCVKPPVVSIEELGECFPAHFPLPEVIVIFPAGSTLPITTDLHSDVFHVQAVANPSHYITVSQTMFVRFSQYQDPLFSMDMINWLPFGQFFTGSVSIGFGNGEGCVPCLQGHIDLNRRPVENISACNHGKGCGCE